MGTKLITFFKNQLNLETSSLTAWSDSKCVLYWLQSSNINTKQWFFYNRIKTIPSLGVNYHYVSPEDNHADIGFQGCAPSDLRVNQLW